MKFIPDEEVKDWDVPYLEDCKADDGWQGQGTSKSIDALKATIRQEIGRLGGTVTRFMLGKVIIDSNERPAAQIEYQIINKAGATFTGRIDVAGPPYRLPYKGNRSHGGYADSVAGEKDKSLRTALFNVAEALKSMRILQMLSPGYAALIPWMIAEKSGQTLGEMWNMGAPALPAPSSGEDDEAIEGSFTEVE